MNHRKVVETSAGLRAVLALERGLALTDLANRVGEYEISTAYDQSLDLFRARTGGQLDLANLDHRAALLRWLRQWGCRHLNLASEATSAAGLLSWAERWVPQLPRPSRPLGKMSNGQITKVSVAYAHLSESVAGARRLPTGESVVTFGPTAAAKTIYVLRPNACPPWDEPIRIALGIGSNDSAYRAYLRLVALALTRTADRAGLAVEELPKDVGRPSSSPPRLIDEYLWMRITQGAGR